MFIVVSLSIQGGKLKSASKHRKQDMTGGDNQVNIVRIPIVRLSIDMAMFDNERRC
jgi:hypothetical protein